MIDSPEAWAPQPPKFKTPWEWSVVGAPGASGQSELVEPKPAPVLKQLGQPVVAAGLAGGLDDIAAELGRARRADAPRRDRAADRRRAPARQSTRARSAAKLLPGALIGAPPRRRSPAPKARRRASRCCSSPEFLRR